MTLRQKQSKFASMVSALIEHIELCGYQVTLGDAARMDGKGHCKNSCHYIRLAIDLNLFKDGKYLTNTKDYQFAGDWWCKQASECRWGGNFKAKDGCHFSFYHNGRA